uniref:Uncharacterized protein n=1 Tax=Rhodnius prolixus TaxID=13249 RepID=T1HWD1_RHOPR
MPPGELEIPLDSNTFQHVSQDGRTYMAAKSLSEGAGMCGYLAVSIGEASKGLWLDSCGRPTCLSVCRKLIFLMQDFVLFYLMIFLFLFSFSLTFFFFFFAPKEVACSWIYKNASVETEFADHHLHRSCSAYLNGWGSKLSDILKTRVSERERKNLTAFYQDILKRIECILHQHKDISDPIDIKDPVIQEMMEKIRCETATVGGLMCAPVDIHARTLLMALKRKVACKLEKASISFI